MAGPTDCALEFLEARLAEGSEQPWCCVSSYYEPNEAMVVGREAYELYDVDSLPLPPNLRDPMTDKPNIYRREQQIFAGVSDDEWRAAKACYLGRITEIDAELGRLLALLREHDALESTIVIVSSLIPHTRCPAALPLLPSREIRRRGPRVRCVRSQVTADHGKYVGGHGMEAHNFGGFEEIYNIPMIVAGPGVAVGERCDGRVGLHDLHPTILELCGAAPDAPARADSRSFAPLLAAPAAQESGYRTGYAEYFGTRFPLSQRILWDGDWKLVFNGFDFDELYCHATDPHELTNLAAEPEHRQRVEEMMAKVWGRVEATGDGALLNTHYYSMRFAAVGPNAARL